MQVQINICILSKLRFNLYLKFVQYCMHTYAYCTVCITVSYKKVTPVDSPVALYAYLQGPFMPCFPIVLKATYYNRFVQFFVFLNEVLRRKIFDVDPFHIVLNRFVWSEIEGVILFGPRSLIIKLCNKKLD